MDKQIHELTHSATDFAADDYIAVDGATDQTRKMSKDDLLAKTAQNALGSIKNLSTTAAESDLVSGNYLALDGSEGTKKLETTTLLEKTTEEATGKRQISQITFGDSAWDGNTITMTSVSADSDTFFVIENKQQNIDKVTFFSSGNVVLGTKNIPSSVSSFAYKIPANSVKLKFHRTVYGASSPATLTMYQGLSYTLLNDSESIKTNTLNIENLSISKADIVYSEKAEIQNYALVSGEFISTSGVFTPYAQSYRTDYIDLETLEDKKLLVTSSAGYSVAICAIYDSSHNFIQSFGKNNNAYVTWTDEPVDVNELCLQYPTAKYIAFCGWPINSPSALVIKTCDIIDTNDAIDYTDSVAGALDSKFSQCINSEGYNENIADEITFVSNSYADKSSGAFTTYSGAKRTDYIDLNDYPNKTFVIRATYGWQTCVIALYNSSKSFLASYGKSSSMGSWDMQAVSVESLISDNPTARYIIVSTLDHASDFFVGMWHNYTATESFNMAMASGGLAGKKWVACGDSFTNGSNLGPSGYDDAMAMYKAYPWWIATRNNMDLVNLSRSGERITNGGSLHFTPDRYKTIPVDADIVTLSFGLNETTVTIGDSTSTDNATLWGAFNEVIGWILTNIPKCKIGIIISDGWMISDIADAEKAIGEFYGIPVLDLKFDSQVPLGIGGRPGVSTDAVDARNGVFQDETNHPNMDAHNYRSTYIEAWMRTL